MGRLTAAKVRTAKPRVGPDGRFIKTTFQDGEGLLLVCAPSGAKSWILRVQVEGKRKDIGLGAADPDGTGTSAFSATDHRLEHIPIMLRRRLTLSEAREKAAALRKIAKAGKDPKAERDRLQARIPTFEEAALAAHETLSKGWEDKTAKAFLASLKEHAVPRLGNMRVNAIGGADVIATLSPIWTAKPVMARKVRHRIGQVLAFSKARGWRTEALPDAKELKTGLSRQSRGGNFAAMPFAEIPDFVRTELAKEKTASRYALLFAILTAARSGEVRQATWEQIDLSRRTWTRPAAVMKMKEGHVVTLSNAAVQLLQQFTPPELRSGLIFSGVNGNPLSDMSLTKALRAAKRSETVHGFRSSFRDWAAERMAHVPAMVAEMALAHRVGSSTEQAYLRSDMREMRFALMEEWGIFLFSKIYASILIEK